MTRVKALNLTRLGWTVRRGSNSELSPAKAAIHPHQNTSTRPSSVCERVVCQNHTTGENGRRPLPCSLPVSEKLRRVERVIIRLAARAPGSPLDSMLTGCDSKLGWRVCVRRDLSV